MHIINAKPGTFIWNVSPELFHSYAVQYIECRRSFSSTAAHSPVPYFLVCRALELELKARHLHFKTRAWVKKEYGHNLKKSYDALPPTAKTLDAAEYAVLEAASKIYDIPNKGFEYVAVPDALTNLQNFPSLQVLDGIALKLVAT